VARIVAIVIVVMLAVTPAGALAAGSQSPLQDTVPQQQPTPAPQTPPPSQTEANSGSIDSGELLLIVAGIAVLIGGIWMVISRDARRVTAGRVRTADSELGAGRGGSPTRAGRRSRRLSAEERRRRKRGRAR
jgi:hypothetical protein